jgi:hypothetical protein
MMNPHKSASPEDLLRPEVLAMSSYHVPAASGLIKLDAMENPYHLPEDLQRALGERLASLRSELASSQAALASSRAECSALLTRAESAEAGCAQARFECAECALALGAALGTIAVIVRQEIVLFIMGGVFVVETLSVMLQVASFKLTGKRIFRMAPLHHHYELKGWKENQVVVRFWIITMMLVLVGLSTLKLR